MDFKEIIESINCNTMYVENANFSITAGFSNAYVANITYQVSIDLVKQFFGLLSDLIDSHEFELYSPYEPNLNEYICIIRVSNPSTNPDTLTTGKTIYSKDGRLKAYYEPVPYVGVSIELQAFNGVVLYGGLTILTESIKQLTSDTYLSNKQIKMDEVSEKEHNEQASRHRR